MNTNFLFSLLKISSPVGQEQPCADFLLKTFSKYNPHNDKTGNVLVNIPGSGEPIMWTAHMDVVTPCNQLEPVIENGLIKNKFPNVLGIDNKAAIACFYEAIVEMKNNNILHRPIELVFTVEEETTGKGVLEIDQNNITSKEGISIDSAAPLGTIIYTSPYCYDLNWQITGPTGHVKTFSQESSYAWHVLQMILEKTSFGAISDKTNVNFSSINGGHGRNTITESFSIEGEMRSFDLKEAEQFLQQQKNLEAELQELFPRLNISHDHPLINPGYEVTKDNSLINNIQQAFKQTDITPEIIKSYGVADANNWQDAGVNIINLGSGAKYTHTKNEQISINDLEKTVQFLISLVKN